jgi:integrase
MAGRIINRGERTWMVRVFLGRDEKGKRRDHSHTVHGTKKDAQKYLNGYLRDRDLGVFATADAPVGELLDALLLDYKTNGKRYDWASLVVRVHLRPFFSAMMASTIGTDQLQGYIAARQKPTTRTYSVRGKSDKKWTRKIPPASNGTINRELALLRRAFNIGKRASPPKVSTVPTIRKLAENAARKGFFEHDAFVAVRRELPEEIRPVLTFAYFTGCRKGEILGLRWPQVDLAERVIRLEPGTTKNDEARTIFMATELYKVLALQKQARDQNFPGCPWVFARLGERIRSFGRAWITACTKAGLVKADGAPDKLFHDLRRTGVRNLIRAGVPERVAMAISGHKTRAVFDRYNIVSESDLKDAARKMGDYLERKSAPETERRTIGAQPTQAPN